MESLKIDYKKQLEEMLEKEIDLNAIRVEKVNIMFIDPSSTCVGYSIASVNFKTKKAELTDAGAIWFGSDWEHQKRYNYIFRALVNYFYIVKKVDFIFLEQYSVNPKKLMGVNVVSEMNGAIKTAAEENGIKTNSIPPQTWRSILGIKAKVTVNKKGEKERDFKEPTKKVVLKTVKVPEQVISNITNNERNTPSDLYDAVAISLAWLSKHGFKVSSKSIRFNDHVGCWNTEAR